MSKILIMIKRWNILDLPIISKSKKSTLTLFLLQRRSKITTFAGSFNINSSNLTSLLIENPMEECVTKDIR